MDVHMVECCKIDVPKAQTEFRTFTKEFAIKLADSIKVEGMYNAVVVRPNPAAPGRYLLVQGRHRLYAVKVVLKLSLIACNIIMDMDDAEAEMALISENLWRNPLTKPQNVACVQKWWEYYLARHPQAGIKGKAGGDATSRARKQKDSDGSEQAAEGASEARFSAKVAAATGQSEASAARTARLARTFSADQLDVFTQASVSQSDMTTIAKIKDEGLRAEVVNLIASGMEVGDAIKEVMKDQAPRRDNGLSKDAAEAKEAAREEKAPALTDDEWFETYCSAKAAMLGDPARFKADALLFRKLSDPRHAFRAKAKAAVKATAEAGTKGSFWVATNRYISFAHPKDWLLCPDCKGAGKASGTLENPTKCNKCYGGGYLLKTEEYL